MWLEGMTLKVSWDAEVLGFSELGNSLTLGLGSRGGWPLAWVGAGGDLAGRGRQGWGTESPLPALTHCSTTHRSAPAASCEDPAFLPIPLVPLVNPTGSGQACGLRGTLGQPNALNHSPSPR